MIVKRADVVLRVKPRSFHSLLRVHAKLNNIEQHLKQRLILIVTAGRAQDHVWLATPEHQRRRERDARALTGRDHVWTFRIGERGLQALAHQNTRVAGNNCRQPGAARRSTKKIAVFVDYVDAGRVVGPFYLRNSRDAAAVFGDAGKYGLHVQWVAGLLR